MQGLATTLAGDASLSFGAGIDFREGGGRGMRLDANEGLILRNSVLMGAAGVARAIWYLDWVEAPI